MNKLLKKLLAGGPGSGRYPKGSTGNGIGRQGTGRVFVSPNVEENTTLDDAKKALNSDRQKNFESMFRDIAGHALGQKAVQVRSATGVWGDGGENSTELHTTSTDRDARRYAAALAGKAANQKAVLDWENSKAGQHTLHMITAKGTDSDTLNSKLGAAGIEYRTVEASPDGKSSRAYVIDQDGTLADKVSQFAKDNGYDHKQGKGTGEFIGSWDSRDEGRAAYDKIIQAYEAAYPERRYTGKLEFAGDADALGTTQSVWGGQDRLGIRGCAWFQTAEGQEPRHDVVHRIGQVALTKPDPIQQNLARKMDHGMLRAVASSRLGLAPHLRGEIPRPLVLRNVAIAKASAHRLSNKDTVVQVYDHTGTVIFATGGGKASLGEN